MLLKALLQRACALLVLRVGRQREQRERARGDDHRAGRIEQQPLRPEQRRSAGRPGNTRHKHRERRIERPQPNRQYRGEQRQHNCRHGLERPKSRRRPRPWSKQQHFDRIGLDLNGRRRSRDRGHPQTARLRRAAADQDDLAGQSGASSGIAHHRCRRNGAAFPHGRAAGYDTKLRVGLERHGEWADPDRRRRLFDQEPGCSEADPQKLHRQAGPQTSLCRNKQRDPPDPSVRIGQQRDSPKSLCSSGNHRRRSDHRCRTPNLGQSWSPAQQKRSARQRIAGLVLIHDECEDGWGKPRSRSDGGIGGGVGFRCAGESYVRWRTIPYRARRRRPRHACQ